MYKVEKCTNSLCAYAYVPSLLSLGASTSGLWPLGQHQNSLWTDKANDPSSTGCNNILFHRATDAIIFLYHRVALLP